LAFMFTEGCKTERGMDNSHPSHVLVLFSIVEPPYKLQAI
jgi:hypothetical protein